MPVGTVPQAGNAATIHAASTGLMVGAQDPMMGFPSNVRFTPFAYFRNMGDQPAKLTARLYYDTNGHTQSVPVAALWIHPHESSRLPLKQVIESMTLNGAATLAFDYDGPPASLLAETGSVDHTGTYVFETIPRITGNSASKSSMYWSIANGFDTMFSLWNPSEKAQDLLLTFYFGSDQTYVYPVHLAPFAQAMVDVNRVASMGSPDEHGRTFPASATEGRLLVTAASGSVKDVINVAIDSGIYNPFGNVMNEAGMSAKEAIQFVSSNPSGYVTSNPNPIPINSGQWSDYQSFGFASPPPPTSGEYLKTKQTITVQASGATYTVRINCIYDTYNAINITDVTANPGATCQ